MFETMNTGGYDLIWEDTNKWLFVIKGSRAFEGTLKEIARLMVKKGFALSELERAIDDMLKSDHNGIHFGMFKGAIFTFKKEEKRSA